MNARVVGDEPAQYVIAKQNAGSARVYKTQGVLVRALVKAGAHRVTFSQGRLYVEWNAGVVDYAIDAQGNIDAQLAWDMEP